MEVRPGPILLGSLVAFGAWSWWDSLPVRRAPGVLAPDDPAQRELDREDRPFQVKDYRIVPLARYAVKARVLSRERYRFDAGAELSPVDLVLGWGPMSDSAVLKAFDIDQSNRWYHWRAGTLPISEAAVITHSANTHLIPADALVRRAILGVKTGDLVDLEGYLVRVEGPHGFTWVSSLTRADTGDGSCELMFVKEARREAR
jgi:hypothetical protein